MNETFKELFARSYQARREDRLADSRATFLQGVRNAAEEADRPSLAEALCGLAQAERDIGNPEAASRHYANAAVLYRQVGPPTRLARGGRTSEMCHPAEAESLYLEAAGIYRQLGEKATLDLANSLRGLALVNEPAAKMDASKTLWQEAVSYMRNAM
jgi:hypothetical protein